MAEESGDLRSDLNAALDAAEKTDSGSGAAAPVAAPSPENAAPTTPIGDDGRGRDGQGRFTKAEEPAKPAVKAPGETAKAAERNGS